MNRALLLGGVFLVLFLGILFVWAYHGVPIHDFNLWRLEKSFAYTTIRHPSDSVLLEKKVYLGGPDTHGSGRCVYAVGEMRASILAEGDIRRTYQDVSVKFGNKLRLPLKVFFADGKDWPQESPFVDWQDELWNMPQGESVLYVVYVSTKYPFLGDWRCDD